jgi:hypothetical protein
MTQPAPLRRTLLDDLTLPDAKRRLLLALSLLGHRADDPDVQLDLLHRVLMGESLMALSTERVSR